MTTGPSTKPLSERLAERRQRLLDETDSVTQQQLNEHASALQQQLSDARRTTEAAIDEMSRSTSAQLTAFMTEQRRQIEQIEHQLSTAASQAERLSRVGGLRSWTRPLAITLAAMLAVGVVTAGGLKLTDRLIDNRWQTLATLNDEIERAKQVPRLPQGVEIQTLSDGQPYLIGIDPKAAWHGTINDGKTPVIRLGSE